MYPIEFDKSQTSDQSLVLSIGFLKVQVEADHTDISFRFASTIDDSFFLERRVMTFSDVSFEIGDKIEWEKTNSCPKVNVYFALHGHIHFNVTHEGVIIDIWDEKTEAQGTVDSIALEWSDFMGEAPYQDDKGDWHFDG